MGLAHAIALLPLVQRRPPMAAPRPAAPRPGSTAATSCALPVNPHGGTARQLAEFGFELQLSGELDFADSQLLSRAPELHPAYGRTVGRLTGETDPADRVLDHLERWEDRLAFAERYSLADAAALDRMRRVLRVLRRAAARRDVAVRSRRIGGH